MGCKAPVVKFEVCTLLIVSVSILAIIGLGALQNAALTDLKIVSLIPNVKRSGVAVAARRSLRSVTEFEPRYHEGSAEGEDDHHRFNNIDSNSTQTTGHPSNDRIKFKQSQNALQITPARAAELLLHKHPDNHSTNNSNRETQININKSKQIIDSNSNSNSTRRFATGYNIYNKKRKHFKDIASTQIRIMPTATSTASTVLHGGHRTTMLLSESERSGNSRSKNDTNLTHSIILSKIRNRTTVSKYYNYTREMEKSTMHPRHARIPGKL